MSSGPAEPAARDDAAAEIEPAHAPGWLNIGAGSPARDDVPPPADRPDPAWAPPTSNVSRWRRWFPSLALALVCLLAFSTAAVALQEPRPSFDRYLPPEGSAATVRMADGKTAQLEQTVLVKTQINSLGHLAGVLEALRPEDQLQRISWLRATITPSAPTSAVVVFSLLDGVLAFEGFNTPRQAVAFSPGIALARQDGGATAATQPGTAVQLTGDHNTYTATVTSAPATDPACPTWVVKVSPLPAPMGRLAAEVTLCRQGGLRAFSATSGAGRYGFAQTGPLAGTRFAGDLTPVAASWVSAPAWRRVRRIIYQQGGFGIEALTTSPIGDPAPRPGGGLVVISHFDEDILALGPPAEGLDAVELQWRVHPGGSIRSVASLGELTLAATTQRAVVAYGPDGARIWTKTFDDVVAGPLVVSTVTETVVVATLDGKVAALDARTGVIRWTHDVGADLALGARVSDRHVVVADSGGGVTLLDLRTGRPVWAKSSDTAASQLAATDTTVFVLRGAVTAIDADSGDVLWSRRVAGNQRNGLVATDAEVTAATQAGVVAFEARTGTPRWTAPGSQILLQRGNVSVVGTGSQITALRDGATVGSWTLKRSVASYGRCECTSTPTGLAFPGQSGIEVLQ